MSQNFLEKAAAKASIINLGYDIKRLKRTFPQQPSASSSVLIGFLENAALAFLNGASVEQVKSAATASDMPRSLSEILDLSVDLAAAASQKDEVRTAELGKRLDDAFLAVVGSPLVRPQGNENALSQVSAAKNRDNLSSSRGCGCLVVMGFFAIGCIGITISQRALSCAESHCGTDTLLAARSEFGGGRQEPRH